MTDEEISTQVENAAQVIAHYGHWPSFHDADLVKIDIDMAGPTVTAEFRLYDWDQAVGRAKRPRLVMKWKDVTAINLSGIDELGQNAVSHLELFHPTDEEEGGIGTTISSTGTGTDMQIRAATLRVICFERDENWQYERIESWQIAQLGQVTQA